MHVIPEYDLSNFLYVKVNLLAFFWKLFSMERELDTAKNKKSFRIEGHC